MKSPKQRRRINSKRLELGKYVVADPAICHGKLTFKGTRVFVSDILTDIERGLPWEYIVERWGGKINKDALAEAVHLSRSALLAPDGTLSASAAHLAGLPRAA